jgi:hypothetical protein
MENKKDTLKILNKFFVDCFGFWLREDKSIKEALALALGEVAEATHNPFDPYGKLLEPEGKQEFVERIEKELEEM